MDEILAQIDPLRKSQGVHIDFPSHDGPQHIIRVDKMRFKQILINLISNAIKYNREGGTITIISKEKPEGMVALGVTDTGLGIDAKEVGTIFKPFERLDFDSGKIEGTGIGLTITKRLVELMAGNIEVASEPGKGSCFTVIFQSGKKT